jgi:hypothetical protein
MADWPTIRGAYELNVRRLTLVGLGATRGAIDVFAMDLATGALRLMTGRAEPFCTIGLIPWPEALWIVAKPPDIKQSAENIQSFINCSAD